MHSTKKAIIFALICTLFTSLGQILWKFGLFKIWGSNLLTILNVPFICGFIAYGLGALFMILSFKYGDLSLVYPLIATGYVWVSLASPWFFPNDTLNLMKGIGVIVIVISVGILGWGSSKKEVAPLG